MDKSPMRGGGGGGGGDDDDDDDDALIQIRQILKHVTTRYQKILTIYKETHS